MHSAQSADIYVTHIDNFAHVDVHVDTNTRVWMPVANISHESWAKSAKMQVQPIPPIREVMVIPAGKISKISSGHYVVDFGNNLAGVCRLELRTERRQSENHLIFFSLMVYGYDHNGV